MKLYSSLVAILLLSTASTGCSVVVGGYSNSVDSQVTLRNAKEKNAKAVSVGRVTHAGLDESDHDIGCRALNLTPQQTFTQYIRGALVDELRLGGMYDETSPLKIIANLSQLKLSTTGDASWTIVVTFSVDGATYTSTVEHRFTAPLDGSAACQNAAAAFPAAVQKLISQFFLSKEFTDAVSPAKAAPSRPAPKKR